MSHHFILRIVVKLLLPVILLFALYVQFHGDYGPGGGFQAGVIFGAGFILYAMIFGLRTAQRVARPWLIRAGVALGVTPEALRHQTSSFSRAMASAFAHG